MMDFNLYKKIDANFKKMKKKIDNKRLIKELRSEIIKIRQTDSSISCSDITWIDHRDQLQRQILDSNPNNFINWEIIQKTMFHYPNDLEFTYLQSLNNWDIIKDAIVESPTGTPPPYSLYPTTSGNLIHHAYSLLNFLNLFQIDLKENKGNIFEFGGGYGSFCRLFYNLGFNGQYWIYDQPEFSALQKFFLKSSLNENIDIQHEKIVNSNLSILLISDINYLKKVINETKELEIFIALWSISECPLELRNALFEEKIEPKYFFFAYQDKYETINNSEYFEEFKKTKKNYNWSTIEIPHLPENYYLYGEKIF